MVKGEVERAATNTGTNVGCKLRRRVRRRGAEHTHTEELLQRCSTPALSAPVNIGLVGFRCEGFEHTRVGGDWVFSRKVTEELPNGGQRPVVCGIPRQVAAMPPLAARVIIYPRSRIHYDANLSHGDSSRREPASR